MLEIDQNYGSRRGFKTSLVLGLGIIHTSLDGKKSTYKGK